MTKTPTSRPGSGPATLLETARLGRMLEGVCVIDAHMHLGEWFQFYTPVRDAAGAVKIMDRVGIRSGIASAHAAAIAGDLRAGNDLVIAAAQQFPGRLYGYVVANPNHADDMVAEIERCAKQGLRALKVHTYHGKPYDAPEYAPAFEFADQRSWPVLAHSGPLDVFDRLAATYKGIRWVLAHSASADAATFADIARKRDNVFFDTCASASEYDSVESLVRAVGVERVLFGSDAVFLSATQQIGRILFARLSDDDKLRILGLNALRVFDLPEPPAPVEK